MVAHHSLMSDKLARFLACEYDRGSARERRPAGPHPDENVWALLADGLISPEERDGLLSHAEMCSECRQRVAATVREWDDDLVIASGRPARGFADEERWAARPSMHVFRTRIISLWGQHRTYALAACVLIAVGAGLYWGLRPRGYGIDEALLVAANAPLTDMGLVLGRRGVRDDIKAAISEAEYRDLIIRLESELTRPEPATETLALATRAALSARFFDDAARYSRQWTDAAPKDAPAHNTHGLALFHQNEFARALSAFAQAIELAPDRMEYRLNAALAADEADHIDQARNHLRHLKATVPNHPQMREIDRWLNQLSP